VNSLIVSWSGNGNGSGTVYEVYNVTTGAVAGTTQSTSYTVTGLSASTEYRFKVRAQYLSDTSSYTAYTDNSGAVSTSAVPPSSGGSSSPAPTPSVPSGTQVTQPTLVTIDLPLSTPVVKTIGASTHTFTLTGVTENLANITIQSDPIKTALALNKSQDLDTNKDGIKDLRVTYVGSKNGKPVVQAINLTDEGELKNALTINAGAYTTNNNLVTLTLNSPNAVQMAISNSSDFSNAEFQSYQKNVTWSFPSKPGLKTVYVRFRSVQGGTATVSDSITLAAAESVVVTPIITPVQTTTPVVTPVKVSPSVTFTNDLRPGMTGEMIKTLQIKLQTMGFLDKKIKPNGVYGPATTQAVKKFQKSNKISPVGVIGPQTRSLLNK
jgi:hypothetical protein